MRLLLHVQFMHLPQETEQFSTNKSY